MARKAIVRGARAAKRKNVPKGTRHKAKGTRSKGSVLSPQSSGLVIERIAVERLKPAPYNPRVDQRPGDAAYDSLVASIDAFGCVEPLVWNKRTGHLVGGRQRLEVLVRETGATELDVSVVDLPIDQEKALNLALNRIRGEWDNAKLAEVLADLQAAKGVDPSVTGFGDREIQALADQAELGAAAGPELVTQTGQEFKVIAECIDAQQQEHIRRLLVKRGVACHTRTRN